MIKDCSALSQLRSLLPGQEPDQTMEHAIVAKMAPASGRSGASPRQSPLLPPTQHLACAGSLFGRQCSKVYVATMPPWLDRVLDWEGETAVGSRSAPRVSPTGARSLTPAPSHITIK